jgi:hypothetical protein
MVFGPKASQSSIWPQQSDRHGEFHCDIDEMDRLVVALFKLASANPLFYSTYLSTVGVSMIKQENREATFWKASSNGPASQQ